MEDPAQVCEQETKKMQPPEENDRKIRRSREPKCDPEDTINSCKARESECVKPKVMATPNSSVDDLVEGVNALVLTTEELLPRGRFDGRPVGRVQPTANTIRPLEPTKNSLTQQNAPLEQTQHVDNNDTGLLNQISQYIFANKSLAAEILKQFHSGQLQPVENPPYIEPNQSIPNVFSSAIGDGSESQTYPQVVSGSRTEGQLPWVSRADLPTKTLEHPTLVRFPCHQTDSRSFNPEMPCTYGHGGRFSEKKDPTVTTLGVGVSYPGCNYLPCSPLAQQNQWPWRRNNGNDMGTLPSDITPRLTQCTAQQTPISDIPTNFLRGNTQAAETSLTDIPFCQPCDSKASSTENLSITPVPIPGGHRFVRRTQGSLHGRKSRHHVAPHGRPDLRTPTRTQSLPKLPTLKLGVASGDVDKARYLLLARRKVADIRTEQLLHQDADGDTLLHRAITFEVWEKVSLLRALLERLDREGLLGGVINECNKLGQSPLYLATAVNLPMRVKELVDFGADPNICAQCTGMRTETKAAIHCAAQGGHLTIETLRQLLKAPDRDPNIANSEGLTALHCAIQEHGTVDVKTGVTKNCIPTIEALLMGGADPDAQDSKSGKTPLMFATETKDYSVVYAMVQLIGRDRLRNMLKTQTFDGSTCSKICSGLRMETGRLEDWKKINQLLFFSD